MARVVRTTWQGFVYVAFIIDVFARVIVGWRVSSTAHTDFVLEQALCQRQPEGKVTHHSDRGVSMCLFATRKDWLKQASLPLSEVLGIPMITPWPGP